MIHLLAALERVASGETQICSPAATDAEYEEFQAIAEALLEAGRNRLVYRIAEQRSLARATYGHIVRVIVLGGLRPEGIAMLASLRHQASMSDSPKQVRTPGLFISYRRHDSEHIVGRMYDSITAKIGSSSCFKDVNSIDLGTDFRRQLSDALERCDRMLVVIGKEWLSSADENGLPRLQDPADYVRLEIATALGRGIPVVPILVSGAQRPASNALPVDIGELSYRQSFEIRGDPYFHDDMRGLYRGIGLSGSEDR